MEPPYISSLSAFYFDDFEGLEHKVEFEKYILMEARVMKTMTIKVSNEWSKERILEKLLTLPRDSTTCLFTVECGI